MSCELPGRCIGLIWRELEPKTRDKRQETRTVHVSCLLSILRRNVAMNEFWPWLTLALLGGYHGLNPAMGWLFAVALGLQERRRLAVIRAFVPIALGHAASVAAVVALLGAAQALLDLGVLRLVGAGALVIFGLYKLLAPMSHPRWVGMRVNFRDLSAWSFLMATAHGAGLMLLPVLLRLPSGVGQASHEMAGHAAHAAHMQMAGAVAA